MLTRLKAETRCLASGSEAKVVSFHATELTVEPLCLPAQLRANEWAHHFYHSDLWNCRVWAVPEVSDALGSELEPSLATIEREQFFSLRSLLVNLLQAPGPLPKAYRTFVDIQRHRGKLALAKQARPDTPPTTVYVGQLGSLRTLGHSHTGAYLLNAHYFASSPEEYDTPHTVLGDVAGIWATGGIIASPLLTPRSCLYLDDTGWHIRPLALEELKVQLPDGTALSDSPETPFFRRGFTPKGKTPDNPNVYELVLVGRTVVSLREGGGRLIPYGGLIVTLPEAPSAALTDALRQARPVTYTLKMTNVKVAVQTGPQLIKQGEPCITRHSFEQEAFYVERGLSGTIPYRFPADVAATRTARAALGLTREGELVGVAVEGKSHGREAEVRYSGGATLRELATLMLELGAVDAINLDGGGSAQLFAGSGALIQPGVTRGLAFATYDRLIPTGLVFK